MAVKSKIQNPKFKKPDIRYLNDIKTVLYDRKWAKTAPNFELYYMHRDIKEKNGLRYDITVIPSQILGKEFVKTKGHEHCGNFGEVYIVLSGRAIFLIQKYRKGKVEDIYAVKAKKGETVIIPPGYGHTTINPSPEELKIANWISKKCKSNYHLYEKKQGAGYFFTRKGWIKNKNYVKIPLLRFEKPLKSVPANLSFLKNDSD